MREEDETGEICRTGVEGKWGHMDMATMLGMPSRWK